MFNTAFVDICRLNFVQFSLGKFWKIIKDPPFTTLVKVQELISFILRSYVYIRFRHYQSLFNSYNMYTLMICSNQSLFRAFPLKVSLALKYPNKYFRYGFGQQSIFYQISLQFLLGFLMLYWAIKSRINILVECTRGRIWG